MMFVAAETTSTWNFNVRWLVGPRCFQALLMHCHISCQSAQVKEQLVGLASQPTWNAPAPANEFGLPSFSAYPGARVAEQH
jgi:hypothetical protein